MATDRHGGNETSTNNNATVTFKEPLIEVVAYPRTPPLNDGGAETQLYNTTKTLGELLAPGKHDATTPWLDQAVVSDLIDRAYAVGSEERGIDAARKWATEPDGTMFKFSDIVLSKDGITLESVGNDLDKLIRVAQDRLRNKGRLSLASVDATLTPEVEKSLTDPQDAVRIRELVAGVKIPLSHDFVPQGNPEPLRPRYRTAMPAVQKLLLKQAEDGTILLLPTALLVAAYTLHPLHYQSLGWATKADSVTGRVTGDMTFTEWISSLNGLTKKAKEEVRRQVVDKWGDIVLPTLDDIVHDILLMADKHGWEAISLFKKDIAAAFHRLLFHPDSVALTAFAVDDIYTIIHLVGNFGWTGMPNAWDVIGRIMLAACRPKIEGTLKLYVDDFFGACLTRLLESNNTAIDGVIRTLLGEEALAPKKDKQGRQLIILGWLFDLDTRTVAVSEKNLLKTLYAFLVISGRDRAHLVELERAASYATRYSVLCRQMSGFLTAIYRDIAGFKGDRRALHTVSAATKVDIALWTSYLILTASNPNIHARLLESFRPKPVATINFGFDGSLRGVGSGVRRLKTSITGGGNSNPSEPTGADTETTRPHTRQQEEQADDGDLVGFAGIFPLPCIPTTDSSYQNTFELMSVIVCMLICAYLGINNFSFSASGDSRTTLSWLDKDKVSSAMGRRAAIAYAIIASTIGAHNSGTIFVRGILNTLFDALSRGVETDETKKLPPELRFNCPAGSPAHQLIALLDPLLPDMSTAETLTFVNTVSQLLSEIQEAGRNSRKRLSRSGTDGNAREWR